MTIFRSAACAATLLAGATLIVSPVAAATRTVPITVPLSARPAQPPAWNSANEIYQDHRRERYRRHHDGFDGGDLLTVLLIGGGIAAVATAIGNDQDKRRSDRTDGRDYRSADRSYEYRSDGTRMPDRDYRRPSDGGGADRAYDDRDSRVEGRDGGRFDSRETDRAVAACSAEAARSGEVDEIFDVAKIDGEWRIKGDYRNGREFTCSVDGNGKAYVGMGDQARNDTRDTPGGEDEADDRYATAQSPDFADPRGR